MQKFHLHPRFLVALAIYFGILAGCASTPETSPNGRMYQPSSDALADIRQVISQAGDKGRFALVVLGANWCHDSRALASRLQEAPLSTLIQTEYELIFVDVGFYELDRSVVQQLGVPHYYATPTVLIVDPSTGLTINDEDRHIWGNAYNIDMPASVQYFDKWATKMSAAGPSEESEEFLRLNAEIDQFETHLADRLVGGYAAVGPMLQATVGGDKPGEFDAGWDELRDFRMGIPGTIHKLREEAQRRVVAGERDIRLVLPKIPLMSWENE